MLNISPEDVLSFEINRQNVPGVFRRMSLRRNVSKMCREQSCEAEQDLLETMHHASLSYEDVIQGNETWESWQNEKRLFVDRIEMRKELLGLEIARLVLDTPSLGSLDLRIQLIEESNKETVQNLLS